MWDKLIPNFEAKTSFRTFMLFPPGLPPGSFSTLEKGIKDAEGREPDPQAQRASHFHNQVKQAVRLFVWDYEELTWLIYNYNMAIPQFEFIIIITIEVILHDLWRISKYLCVTLFFKINNKKSAS